MKTAKKVNNLVQAGVPCKLAENVVKNGFSLSSVKKTSKSELSKYFTEAEATILFNLKRRSIPQEIIDRLNNESAARCCLCWQWDKQPPLIIHHIEEHSKTQDDSYGNLVLLCLNHHARVHTVSKLSRQENPPDYVRSQKRKWIHAVAEYQAGRRPKPGTEKTQRIYRPTAPPPEINFIGREKALKQISKRLQGKRTQVLAISGMGGIGKTALAKKVVEQVNNDYSGGVLWASLSEVNGEAVPIFLTWALICGDKAFAEQNTTDFAYLIRNILTTYTAEHGRILIVIDDVREDWLSNAILLQHAAPQDSSILLTTRNREIARSFNARLTNLGGMLPNKAIEMLGHLIDISFIEQEMSLVQKLLKELGYLPLAVELAGKRIGLEQHKPGFSLDIFLEAIRSRAAAKLIVKGHRGLAATFSITYDSLQSQYQTVFRQISIFATNLFSVNQAAAITGLDLERTEIILDDLVMQSLLQWGSIEGEYTFHPLLKQFAVQLFSVSIDEQSAAQNRYADLFINYAADNAKETLEAYQALDQTWLDIQKAFNFVLKQKNDKEVNHLANILCRDSRFLYVRGYAKEAVRILTEAIRVCHEHGWKANEVGHLIHIGTAYNHLGETKKSLHSYQSALNLNHQLQDPQNDGVCLNNLGLLYYDIGQLDQATDYFIQALQIAKEYQDSYLMADVLGSLGSVQRSLGNVKEARNHYSSNLELTKMLKNRLGEGSALSNIGLTYYDEQDYEISQKYISQGLKIAREIGDRRGEANRLGHLGNISNLTGNPEQGITYYLEAISISRAISHRMNEAHWLGNMGNSYGMLGKFGKACDLFRQAIDIRQEIGDVAGMCTTLLNMGHSCLRNGEKDEAFSAWVAAYQLALQMNLAQELQVLERLAGQLGMPSGLAGWAALSRQMSGQRNNE